MSIVVIGDFADPLSFLASQRLEQIRSLGLHDITWLAVEADPSRPLGGGPLEASLAADAARLFLTGEAVPESVTLVNSRAATAAYAEAWLDGRADAMRRALFDAIWLEHRPVADYDVIRAVAFAASEPAVGDIDARIRANAPIVPLGDPDTRAVSRRLGYVVSPARGPVSIDGHRLVEAWRRRWERHGAPALPLLVTDLGEAVAGERALDRLAAPLAHAPAVVS